MNDDLDLRRLIKDAKGDRAFERFSRDCGGVPTDKRLQQLANTPIKAFPDRETIEGIARGASTTVAAVVLAAARSLGLKVPSTDSDPDALVIGNAANLGRDQRAALFAIARTFDSLNRIANIEAMTRFVVFSTLRLTHEIERRRRSSDVVIAVQSAEATVQTNVASLEDALASYGSVDGAADAVVAARQALSDARSALATADSVIGDQRIVNVFADTGPVPVTTTLSPTPVDGFSADEIEVHPAAEPPTKLSGGPSDPSVDGEAPSSPGRG